MHLRHRRITSVLKQFAFKVISGLQFYQELAKIISKKLLLYLIHHFNTFERNHPYVYSIFFYNIDILYLTH